MQQSQTHLSKIVSSESTSVCYPPMNLRLQDLQAFRKELVSLLQDFQQFKDGVMGLLNQSMGKVINTVYKCQKEKRRVELQNEKQVEKQRCMKLEVIQLKQMISEFVSNYTKQLAQKDREIDALRRQIDSRQPPAPELSILPLCNEIKPLSSLETIQEESSNVTNSSYCVSVRDVSSKCQEEQKQQKEENIKSESKKTKSFLDCFRKNIEESLSEKKKSKVTEQQPSKLEFNLVQTEQIHHSYVKEQKKESPCFSNANSNLQINLSQSSSASSLAVLAESHHINIPKKFDSPKNMQFVKRKEKPVIHMLTEPSPDKNAYFQKQNDMDMYFSTKNTPKQTRIVEKRRLSGEKMIGNSVDGKNRVGGSKEKIKVTSKMMVDQINGNGYSRKTKVGKALVHLGGIKSSFRKMLSDLKAALKEYVIFSGRAEDEIKYEGQKRGNSRWGKGTLFYRNGLVYDGDFRENLRHGNGKLTLNGIVLYEGEFQFDHLQGQGYIKTIKLLNSGNCSSLLAEGSYIGNLCENRLHGMGTLCLNQKQKIVTKFNNGNPTGELTYYSLSEIEFATWPEN